MRVTAVIPVVGLTLLAGCGAQAKAKAKHTDVGAAIVAKARTCADGSLQRLGSRKVAYAAVVRSRATVSRRPGARAFARFGKLNVNRVPTIFSIRGARVDARCKPRQYLVQIPKRPNGVTAWVPARQVDVETVRTRILVDLSEKRVTLYDRGRKVLSSKAAIGARATPTPTGRFYVNQRLIPTDKHGPFGPGAVGVSAFSNVLTGWTQGGPIAIHGTNAPWSIGKAVSNGCIRIPNLVMKKLFARAWSGTPVLIRS
ncbi:MAG: L,D-transpeptidase [Actinobacteria bacterium]|nr:L,D-transpeptidase [Actinomycetota bacterium]